MPEDSFSELPRLFFELVKSSSLLLSGLFDEVSELSASLLYFPFELLLLPVVEDSSSSPKELLRRAEVELFRLELSAVLVSEPSSGRKPLSVGLMDERWLPELDVFVFSVAP